MREWQRQYSMKALWYRKYFKTSLADAGERKYVQHAACAINKICHVLNYVHALQVMIAAMPLLHMMVWMKKMNYEILERKTV